MIKKLALVFVAVSLMAAPAVLADDVLHTYVVHAYAETSLGDHIEASADDSVGWVSVSGQVNGSFFICFADGIFGLVDVIASAKRGTLDEVDTGDLQCFGGTPPDLISAECIANGQFSDHQTGNGTRKYGDGTTDIWHDNLKAESADCTITADSVLFDQENYDGYLEHRVSFYK
jgi:hypothetical protein